MRKRLLPLLALALAALAVAVIATEFPPDLRTDIAIVFSSGVVLGRIIEEELSR